MPTRRRTQVLIWLASLWLTCGGFSIGSIPFLLSGEVLNFEMLVIIFSLPPIIVRLMLMCQIQWFLLDELSGTILFLEAIIWGPLLIAIGWFTHMVATHVSNDPATARAALWRGLFFEVLWSLAVALLLSLSLSFMPGPEMSRDI